MTPIRADGIRFLLIAALGLVACDIVPEPEGPSSDPSQGQPDANAGRPEAPEVTEATGVTAATEATGASCPDAAAAPVDASTGDTCAPTMETCNGRDDDCDGREDETFQLDFDPGNCGACGHECEAVNAASACVDGECALAGCDDGWFDLDRLPSNGCECPAGDPECDPSAPRPCRDSSTECDGRCVDLDSDPTNCGMCGSTCEPPNASSAACVSGTCRITGCNAGFVDEDRVVANGCECTRFPETCDELDNDCDGEADEAFQLASDPDNCGACGQPCRPSDAVGACVAGTCRIAACDAGFFDRDGLVTNGCECLREAEICDGLDNDCDGVVDATIESGVASGVCTCEVIHDVPLTQNLIYFNPTEASDYCFSPIACALDDEGIVFTYCMDNARASFPWAACVVSATAELNAFDADFGNAGALQVVFEILSPTTGGLNLWYGTHPHRKYVRLLQPDERKDPGRYTMHFAPEQAYFPRWMEVPAVCHGDGRDRCGRCPVIRDDPQFEFDLVDLTLAAEGFSVMAEGSVRLISVKHVSAGCDCTADADCPAGSDRDRCLSARVDGAEVDCRWPAARASGMCGPSVACDPGYVGEDCAISTPFGECNSTTTCERGSLACSAQGCVP